MITDIRAIESQGQQYLLMPVSPESRALELIIKSGFKALGLAVERIRTEEKIDVADRYNEFKQEITLRDFESSARQPVTADSSRPFQIADSASTLIDSLEKKFRARFP